MFTIKSTSGDGIYYLVNHWEKHKTFWEKPSRYIKSQAFSREQDAKTSIKKLLKVMPEYAEDTLELVEISF